MKSLSVVIPVCNSEDSIGILIDLLREILSENIKFEIILINDHSKDNTYEICLEKALKDKRIKLINLSKNFGQHNAIITGLRHAKNDYVAYMDDDLQHRPEDLLKMLQVIEDSDYDVVYAKFKELRQSTFKKFGSKINNIMANLLLDKPKDVRLTSFVVMKNYIAREIANYNGPYAYLGGLIFRITKNVGTVDVQHRNREQGKSNYSFLKLLKLWLNGMTNFSVMPLRIAAFTGFITSFLGFIYLIYRVLWKILHPDFPFAGWTSMIAIILFLGGFQLVSIGLVGEYVGRIFLTINKHPQAVIKEEVNIEEK